MQQLTAETLEQAVALLCLREKRFKPIVKKHGLPSLRAAEADFRSLLIIVTEQFLSLSAAAAIWKRIEVELRPITPKRIAATPVENFRDLGLSTAKAKSFIGIAQAVLAKEFDPKHLTDMSDEDAFKALVALPGIGPWTAEIFLLANLLRPNVFPAGDLALQVAAQKLLGLAERPTVTEMKQISLAWSPHRATAARLLWSHYRDIKSIPQA
jgi:DNA-3-methyladenine glycosylase II